MTATRGAVPAWAVEHVKRMGHTPGNVMDDEVARWWNLFCAKGRFYDGDKCADGERHKTLYPAQAVAQEWASLILNEKTELEVADPALCEWVGERLPGFTAEQADFVARVFALGSGAWSVDLVDGLAVVRSHDAGFAVPLESGGAAFVDRVEVSGRKYDQLQVHTFGGVVEVGGEALVADSWVVTTLLFDPSNHDAPLAVEGVEPVYVTGSELPTFAFVAPAIANTYEDWTPLGVSVYDRAEDAVKAVDEAFDLFYWNMKLGKTRVLVDERALVRDSKTGKVKGLDTVDKRLYRALEGAVGEQMPVTVFNPDLRTAQTEQAINDALSLLSWRCGLGNGYFSFDRATGLKTATEVVASNSQLARNIRRHQRAFGKAMCGVVRGAYAMELAAAEGRHVADADVPQVDVAWDDSVIVDEETERAAMKDDIARGLCPAWVYPVRYYGMGEADARALTGEGDGAPGLPGLPAAADVPEEA